MRAHVPVVLVLGLSAAVAAQSPLPVGRISFGPPETIAAFRSDDVKGDPWRLAWSPDATQLYIQSVEGPYHAPKQLRHFVVSASGGPLRQVQGEPEWVPPYWTWKSHQASPDVPGQKIALESEQKREQTTAVPRGGDLARGGPTIATGTSPGDATMAAYNSQMVTVHTMRLNGEVVGQFVNSAIVPGLTFGWAPQGAGAIAYAAQNRGRIVVMNAAGERQELDGTKDALLPAWSPDGSRLAWLQKDGRRRFLLQVTQLR